jgi:hypothetical protein
VFWRIFGSNGDEATGSWRKLHNEELHSIVYPLPNIMKVKSRRKRRIAGTCNTFGRGNKSV